MPTNQQRRDAAKRKLERQLQRREEQDRARRQRLVIIGVVAAVLVISGGVWLFVTRDSGSDTASDASSTDDRILRTRRTRDTLLVPRLRDGGERGQSAQQPGAAELRNGGFHHRAERPGRSGVSLNRALAPCGVNSFLSLASQGFYDNTDCSRLTVSEQLNILQCGDPTGQGNGGPGYTLRHRGRNGRHLSGRHRRPGQCRREHQRVAVLHRLRRHHAAGVVHHSRAR